MTVVDPIIISLYSECRGVPLYELSDLVVDLMHVGAVFNVGFYNPAGERATLTLERWRKVAPDIYVVTSSKK